MNTSTYTKTNTAMSVSFSMAKMNLQLEDGRELTVPLEWFPKFRDASENQLKNWRFIGGGHGIHWVDLDEDISVANLLN